MASTALKVQRFITICLIYAPLLSAFVVKYEDMAIESIISQTENSGVEKTEADRLPEVFSKNNTEISMASLVIENIANIERHEAHQPIKTANGDVHTALKRSACREPSGADLEVQLQLFRSGFVTTEEPTGAFGAGVDSLESIRDSGFPVYWEGEDCRTAPSDLWTIFPTTSLNGRTACPWRLVQNSEPNRYPRDIQYAQCACTKCAEIPLDSFSIANSCRPVLRDEHVLNRTDQCVDGEYVYEPALEPVPVACACIRRYISTGNMDPN